ncbi:MAG: hypothetical protein EPN93_13640 [Spirochaetes bacterium]|nr:MAG: hypothetical protein EPN93_13640 [Spirochaetota bacterium]
MTLMIRAYENSPYSVQKKVQYFLVTLPFVIVITTALAVTTLAVERRLNPIFFIIILMSVMSVVLLKKGYYLASVNIFLLSLTVIAGFDYVFKTAAEGYEYTHHPSTLYHLMAVIVAASLFCTRITVLLVSALVIMTNGLFYIFAKTHASGEYHSILAKTTIEGCLAVFMISLVSYLLMSIRINAYKRIENELEINKHQYSTILDLINSIKSVSFKLTSHSRELSDNADSFSTSSQGQAAAIEEFTASAEEITSSNELIADSIKDQHRSISMLKEEISLLSNCIEEMSIKINEAQSVSRDVMGSIESTRKYQSVMHVSVSNVNRSSEQMIAILEIIKGISEQIDLLSLNATIEAARAGFSGRGFTVVAKEISNLAAKTDRSISDINTLIMGITGEMNAGIENIEKAKYSGNQAMANVENIANMVNQIFDFMTIQKKMQKTVIAETDKLFLRSEEIRSSANEQEIVLKEMVDTILMFSGINQSHAMGAEELSQSARNVNEIAASLGEMAKHKIEDPTG